MPQGVDHERLTRDPTTANCRIFVGGINASIGRKDLEEFFEEYGKVLAIAIFRGYGFVQFDSEEAAQAALKDGTERMLKGNKLLLKTAVRNTTKGGGGPPRGPPELGPPVRPRPHYYDDGPPEMKRPRGPPRDRDRDRERERGGRDGRDWSPPPGPRGPRRPPPNYDYEEEDDGYDGFHPRYRPGPPGYDDGPGGRHGPGGRPGGPGGPGAPPPYLQLPRPAALEEERANDCEIVVLDRKNRLYAEEVEDRLKNIGLAVDMLFPRAGAPINQVLDQIVSRGTLYAVVVHPTNEQHRSVSLNIMHGNPPQEHRNMPLDDAMSLVARNFEAYMLSNKDKAPPQGIINLLNFVRENRPLTAVEYNRLIRYLEEKRDHQLKPDKTSLAPLSAAIAAVAPKPVPAPVVSVATASQQQIDLQQKILSMMQAYKTQQPSTLPVGSAAPVPPPVLPPSTGVPPPGAPGMARVKSAIDSLVTSGPNLLKVDPDSQQQRQQPPPSQQQQQQYGGGYGYNTQTSSLGRAPANPLFGAYANQRY